MEEREPDTRRRESRERHGRCARGTFSAMSLDLDARIRQEYPAPISYAWWRVLGSTNVADRLTKLRMCSAVFVRWLCAMLLAEYRLGPVDPDFDRFLEKSLHKFTDGTWLLVLDGLARRLIRRQRRFCPDLLFSICTERGTEGPLLRALKLVSPHRNDEAHVLSGTPASQAARADMFQAALADALASAGFLASYRPVLAEVSASISGRHTGWARCLVGPDEGLPILVDVYEGLVRDAVYCIAPDGRTGLLLHPYVTCQRDEEADQPVVLLFEQQALGRVQAHAPSQPKRTAEFDTHPGAWVDLDESLGQLRYPRSRSTPGVSAAAVPAGAAALPAVEPASRVDPVDNPLTALFEIFEPLGSGGMARVFRARERATGRECALKVMHHDLVGSPTAAERFHREFRDLSTLASDDLVPVYAEGTLSDGRRWIQMGLMRGSLQQRIIPGGQPLGVLLPWAEQMLRSVVALHAANILHRDIKPSNFLVDQEGRVLLSDLGVAQKPGDASLTLTGEGVGTTRYMAPETRQSGACTPRSDLWSLALTLHELHTGGWVPRPGEGVEGVFGAFLRCLGATNPLARPTDAQATVMLAQARREDMKGAAGTGSPGGSVATPNTAAATAAAASVVAPAAVATGMLAVGVAALAVLGGAGGGSAGSAIGRAIGKAAVSGSLRNKGRR